ncbi:methyltransferase-like protein, partial [Tanacetum coccineum]
RAFYFSEEFLKSLFQDNGFTTEECGVCCKQVENRSREIVMNRRWVQAAFRLDGGHGEIHNIAKEAVDGNDIDISDGFTFEMFGISSSMDEVSIALTLQYHYQLYIDLYNKQVHVLIHMTRVSFNAC